MKRLTKTILVFTFLTSLACGASAEDLDMAIADLNTLLTYDPHNAQAQMQLREAYEDNAYAHRNHGDLEGAIANFVKLRQMVRESEIPEINTEIVRALNDSIQLRMRSTQSRPDGDPDGVIQDLETMLQYTPERSQQEVITRLRTALRDNAQAHRNNGDVDGAIANYAKLMGMVREDQKPGIRQEIVDVLNGRIEQRRQQGNLDGVIQDLETVLQYTSEGSREEVRTQLRTALRENAQVSRNHGDTDRAIANYVKLIQMLPESQIPEINTEIVRALNDSIQLRMRPTRERPDGDPDGVIQDLEMMLQYTPESSREEVITRLQTALRDNAQVHRNNGDVDGAIANYAKLMGMVREDQKPGVLREIVNLLNGRIVQNLPPPRDQSNAATDRTQDSPPPAQDPPTTTEQQPPATGSQTTTETQNAPATAGTAPAAQPSGSGKKSNDQSQAVKQNWNELVKKSQDGIAGNKTPSSKDAAVTVKTSVKDVKKVPPRFQGRSGKAKEKQNELTAQQERMIDNSHVLQGQGGANAKADLGGAQTNKHRGGGQEILDGKQGK